MSQDDSSEKKDLNEVLLENAAGPKKVSGDAGAVEKRAACELCSRRAPPCPRVAWL